MREPKTEMAAAAGAIEQTPGKKVTVNEMHIAAPQRGVHFSVDL
jgi:hypothetical protein